MMLTLLLTSLASGTPAPDAPGSADVRLAQVQVQERIIIRVPVRPPAPRPPVSFKEKRGPHCINSAQIVGAAVTSAGEVDFLLRGRQRFRAKFERACPALDFYSGFYLKPSPDGRLCAHRDSIHARSGGACEIQKFRKLEPRENRPHD
jgi:hypothetical protein